MTTACQVLEQVETLGQYLKRVRRDKRVTGPVLARACGFSRSYLEDLEADKHSHLGADTVRRLAAMLGVPECEIAERAVRVTDTNGEDFADYQRVLRSNARAIQALGAVREMRDRLKALKCALDSANEAQQLAQALENTVDSLDAALRCTDRRVVRRTATGDVLSPR